MLCHHSPLVRQFQSFLKNAPVVLLNLKPDENGEIEVELDSELYSAVDIIVSDSEKVLTQRHVRLGLSEIQTKDLRLTDPLDPEKFYNEVRAALSITPDFEPFVIKDIT